MLPLEVQRAIEITEQWQRQKIIFYCYCKKKHTSKQQQTLKKVKIDNKKKGG